MNPNLQQKLALFAQNTQTIKKEFRWQDTMTKWLAALFYALEGQPVDCDAIQGAYTRIKETSGIFSAFRGNMALSLSALLALSGNQETLFSDVLRVYEMLKKTKLRNSDFLVVAAYQIAAHGNAGQYPQIVARTRTFFDGMKAKHWFLTGEDDYIFAAMLGLSAMDVSGGLARMEQIFSRLKPEFRDGNSVQTLAQVLVLGESTDDTLNRLLSLRGTLKEQRLRLDKTYTLPSLGVLALLPADTETIVRDIGEAQSFLRTQKGFGRFSVDTQTLPLFSASIVAHAYAENLKDDVLTASLATSILNIIIAQETAMIAAICASSAAAAASN